MFLSRKIKIAVVDASYIKEVDMKWKYGIRGIHISFLMENLIQKNAIGADVQVTGKYQNGNCMNWRGERVKWLTSVINV
jgi:hypothetical protein